MEPVRLQLDIEFSRDSVAGELRTADGEIRPFQGWLGLIAAIDRERCDPASPAPPLD